MPVLAVERVSKSYDDFQVIKNISLELNTDEIVSIVGPSGCGKSTLFNIIAGLLPSDEGRVLLHDTPTTASTTGSLGYVLQKDLLMPWLTLAQNLDIGWQTAKLQPDSSRARVRELAHKYKLAPYLNRYPNKLSGGMRQRAALIRTLAMDPEIVLMDEAYKALDYPLKLELQGEFVRLVREAKKSALMITHDIEEAVSMSDRVIVLARNPGRILETVKIDLESNSTAIEERRVDARFPGYYEQIWRLVREGAGE